MTCRWAWWVAALTIVACGPGVRPRTVTELRDGAVDALPTLHRGQPVRTCSLVQFVYTQH